MKWHFLDDGVLINNARTSAINESDATRRWMVIITSHILPSSGSKRKQRMDSELWRWLETFWWVPSARTFDIIRSTSRPPKIQVPQLHPISLNPHRLSRQMKVCANVRNICLDIQSLFPFRMSCQHLTRFKYIFISRLVTAETMNIDRENNGKFYVVLKELMMLNFKIW